MVARPDVQDVEVGTEVVDGRVARVLSMRLSGQRMGKWLVLFTSPRRMLQISAVGPAAARTAVDRFLASVGARACQN
jgi:hypothetical protein